MLLNFTFKNYASFRDVQQFSMEIPSKENGEQWKYPELSTVTALYGANASGKSSFLAALWFVSSFVRDGYASGVGESVIPRRAFLLDQLSATDTSEFLIEMHAGDGHRYIYEFAVTDTTVEYEELTAYYSRRPSLLFSRYLTANGETGIKFGPSFSGPKKQLTALLRKNALFLSVTATAGVAITASVFRELAEGFGYYDAAAYRSELEQIKVMARKDPHVLAQMSQLIQYADFGIDEIQVRATGATSGSAGGQGVDPRLSFDGVPDEIMDYINTELKWSLNNELVFHHVSEDGGGWLSQAMESDGTLAGLAFLSVALRTLKNGRVMLVDEIERSLHPVLVKGLISLFTDIRTNPHQAQLIFTSHDVSLITSGCGGDGVLNRNQLWFTRKGKDGASSLCPVTAFSPRPDENLGKNYLNGVYEVLPVVGLRQSFAELMKEDGAQEEEGK